MTNQSLREEFVKKWIEARGRSTHEGEYIADWWLQKFDDHLAGIRKEIDGVLSDYDDRDEVYVGNIRKALFSLPSLNNIKE